MLHDVVDDGGCFGDGSSAPDEVIARGIDKEAGLAGRNGGDGDGRGVKKRQGGPLPGIKGLIHAKEEEDEEKGGAGEAQRGGTLEAEREEGVLL